MKKEPEEPCYLQELQDGSVALTLHIQPKASQNRFQGIHDNALKLAITAPPVDGKANKAVIAFLAKFFGIAKSELSITSGHQSRRKRCLLKGASLAEIQKKIEGNL